ncbi:class I SAM-dependent DNA methyltransferase [Corynebacterium suedekumii]|uniref:site-specific DNA-methyltransferase (adenine-specific) n=1 Tax=Corynebacterium suedekumii TaxID=3049801 RepID=A0ABY8VHV1_9CORY|nr:DNA methyltransferase [Corynebacterium suedekumii]WIM69119.1 GcrY protein [Corynebacterium suedekumii]
MSSIEFLDRSTTISRLQSFGHYWAEQTAAWHQSGETATEKKYAQSFWADLLNCFGIIAARQRLFEREAQRATTGNHGWMDFFFPGVAIGEAKSLGMDLNAAAAQVDDYLSGGTIKQTEFPRYAILTNFDTLSIKKLDIDDDPVVFSITDIANHYDDLVFLIGGDTLTRQEEEAASIKAAQLMAELYVAILGDDADEPVGGDPDAPTNPEDEDEREATASMLMTRLLFLLYGDDAGLWEVDLFYRWVDQETTAASLGAQLGQLFEHLNTPVSRRPKYLPDLIARFPYVNGAVFADNIGMEYFTTDTREALLDACRFQWTSISVSVFGAMFQLVKSKEARRAAGEHYTSESNILKTIGPLFLDEYQGRADRLIRNKSSRLKDFDALMDEMAANIYCDPACGSGNFLNLAYARLREIETALIVEKRKRFKTTGGGAMTLFIEAEQKLSIDQFHGFEIGWWPAKIAETSMFLVDHQANQKLAKAIGEAPERLPITITAHIHHGNALRFDWRDALPLPKGQTFIFGNPPFRGDAKEKEQLNDLQLAWGAGAQLSRMDYVTGWHAKAIAYYHDRAGQFAYVTTNSIVQGDQVPRLFGPIFAAGWHIKFAHRTFSWDSQAPGQAAVHCVIVGFTRDAATCPRLWGYPHVKGEAVEQRVAGRINAYLVDGPNILVTKASTPLSPEVRTAFYGSKPTDGGNLIVETDEYNEVMADPVAAKYLRQYVGARELLHGELRFCLWLDGMDPTDLNRSAILKTRVEAVRDFRAKSKAASTREFADYPHLFRQRAAQKVPYLCIPIHVSENRRFYPVQRLYPDAIASNANFILPDEDGLQFGLMSSSMFMTWQKTVGGRIKSDLRFGSTLTWYTFPVPALTDDHREAIKDGFIAILEARMRHPKRSLADHYNHLVMEPELLRAHYSLDRAIDKAFGAPDFLRDDQERLDILFARYADLTRNRA